MPCGTRAAGADADIGRASCPRSDSPRHMYRGSAAEAPARRRSGTMTRSADELGLVGAAKAGDRMAFACLVERYETRIFAASFRLLGSPDDADDIVQETF